MEHYYIKFNNKHVLTKVCYTYLKSIEKTSLKIILHLKIIMRLFSVGVT